jgi:hypothetical protein
VLRDAALLSGVKKYPSLLMDDGTTAIVHIPDDNLQDIFTSVDG